MVDLKIKIHYFTLMKKHYLTSFHLTTTAFAAVYLSN